jgi:polar amino acid transport system substrate-binding protein
LKQALKLDEFELYYQPYIDMKTGKILGAEALLRWNHSYLGVIPPREFIPLAKKTGLIVEIDKLVIKKAIKQQKQWQLFGYNEIQIAINLTLREVERGDLLSFMKIELNKHKIDPKLINFDISESVTMLDTQITKDHFIALKELGISLALDDFGTGHSSFSHLKDFPLDTLKINVPFVSNMIQNEGYQKIVKAIIDIGHNFDLKVMAKGVEDTQTYQMLKDYGCDVAQGYYFSKPLPVFDFQELIRRDI